METRQAILDAARHLFGDRGVDHTTVDDLAAEVGVSKGAVYHHFSSKEEIFRSILAEHIDEAAEVSQALDEAASFHDLLRLMVETWFSHYQATAEFIPLSLELRLQAARTEWARETVDAYQSWIRSLLAAIVRAGQEANLVRADLDPTHAAAVTFGVLDGVALQWGLAPGRIDLDALAPDVLSALTAYLGVPARKEGRSAIDAVRASLEQWLASLPRSEPGRRAAN